MKIALLTEYYKPEMGAPQNRLYEMANGLRELGNEVCVVTAMPNYPTGKIFDEYRGKFSMEENIDEINVKRYWLYASNSKRALPRILNMMSFSITSLFSLFYLRRRHIDLLIVESPPLSLAWSGRIITLLTGAKLVANISDLWPLTAKEMGALSGDSFLYRILEKIERRFYNKSIFCMGQSEQIVKYISEHSANKVYLFRNGVDPSRFDNLKRMRSDSGFRITYAGLLGFAQGIFEICQNINFKDLGVEFHIYGAGGEQAEIEKFLKTNPDRGIYYHGSVSRDEIPQVLVDSDATLIPLMKNIYGAVPSKIYESMAAGIPIIFSGEGEGRHIIEDNNIGWTAPARNYQKLKNIISFMKSHPEVVKEKKRCCIECANMKFNRTKQIVELNNFIHKNFAK